MEVFVTTETTDVKGKEAYEAAKTDVKKVKYTVTKGSAATPCVAMPDGQTAVYAKFTAAGYAKPTAAAATNTTNATGAKNLAAAFTAGALAVAATQFWATLLPLMHIFWRSSNVVSKTSLDSH